MAFPLDKNVHLHQAWPERGLQLRLAAHVRDRLRASEHIRQAGRGPWLACWGQNAQSRGLETATGLEYYASHYCYNNNYYYCYYCFYYYFYYYYYYYFY
jgi:hypothetical protein